MQPFWPRHSPFFLACRRSLRDVPGNPVIGLSGGADSLALVAAARAEGREVHAVVVDHGLQPGSAEVAAAAAAKAQALGATAEIVPVTVGEGNVEARAREARYRALREAARARGRALWVAHTADDQAETVLLSGLRGQLSAMSVHGEITRPFLRVRRADTRGACAELGLKPWDDPMNEDLAFLRVALRREVLPLLGELAGRDPVEALAAAGALVAEDRELLDELAASAFAEASQGEGLVVDKLKKLAPALRRRVLAAYLHERKLKVSAAILQSIDSLVTSWSGQGGVAVGGNSRERLEIVRKDGKLCVIARRKATS